ncbi:MAG: hypothetical protein CSA64_00450 [Arachnia propionica]|nr:MAG: hypothetical protein CSA64_00450 [Arachnia propionica]
MWDNYGMDILLLITVGLMMLIFAVSAGIWARYQGVKIILIGLGWTLIPLALYLIGISRLLGDGVAAVIKWANETSLDTTMIWGISLLATALMFLIVGKFLPAPWRKKTEAAPQVTKDAKPAVATPAQQPARAAEETPEHGLTADEAAILRDRGIM